MVPGQLEERTQTFCFLTCAEANDLRWEYGSTVFGKEEKNILGTSENRNHRVGSFPQICGSSYPTRGSLDISNERFRAKGTSVRGGSSLWVCVRSAAAPGSGLQ